MWVLLSSDRQGGAVRADASGWGSGLFVYWRRELLKSSLSLSGCLGITGWSFQHHDHSPLNAEETTPHCPVCTLGCTDIFKCNNWYQPIMDIYCILNDITVSILSTLSPHCTQQYSKAPWLLQLYVIYCIIICKNIFTPSFYLTQYIF